MNFNFKLFDKVVDGFRTHPERLAMGVPLVHFTGESAKDPDNHNFKLKPRCKTVGCFAGWTNIVGEKGRLRDKINTWEGMDWETTQDEALEKLGLSTDTDSPEYRLASTLFHVLHWPEPYKERYEEARTPKQKLRAALGRFSLFKKEVRALAKRLKEEQ